MYPIAQLYITKELHCTICIYYTFPSSLLVYLCQSTVSKSVTHPTWPPTPDLLPTPPPLLTSSVPTRTQTPFLRKLVSLKLNFCYRDRLLTCSQNPSVISSAGAIGKQFNPDGAIGQIGEKIGGPLSSQGVIGSQFDASKDGIAGHVERAVDGPRNPAGSDTK